jgi:hypothetical protein
MATADKPPIEKTVDGVTVNSYLRRWGHLPGALSAIQSLDPPAIRESASQIRALPDPDGLNRPELIADGLTKLAAEAEGRPYDGSDRINITDGDAALFCEWERRCRAGSPLLEPMTFGRLDWLIDRDPRVSAARSTLDLLVDADKLLPGIDAALRPSLTRYAGLPLDQAAIPLDDTLDEEQTAGAEVAP